MILYESFTYWYLSRTFLHKQIAKFLIMKKMQSYEIKIWKIRKMKKICRKSKMFKLSKKHLRGG